MRKSRFQQDTWLVFAMVVIVAVIFVADKETRSLTGLLLFVMTLWASAMASYDLHRFYSDNGDADHIQG